MNIRKLRPKKFYKIGPRSPRRMLRRRVSSTGDFGKLESEEVRIQDPGAVFTTIHFLRNLLSERYFNKKLKRKT
jgi:hypothetical protein